MSDVMPGGTALEKRFEACYKDPLQEYAPFATKLSHYAPYASAHFAPIC
jgi:hypothetical protein